MMRFESIFAKSSTVRPARLVRRVQRAILSPRSSFHAARIAVRPGTSMRNHIFLVGMPRAGTSLLATILTSHPALASPGDETQFFLLRNYHYSTMPGLPTDRMDALLRVAASKADLFDRMADVYLTADPPACRFLEKTPGHGLLMPELMTMFPSAKFVFIVREPRDAYASLGWSDKLPDFSPQGYCSFYNALADARAAHLGSRVHPVRYEDLVTDPAKTVRAITAFLDLDYRDELIAPETHAQNAKGYGSRDHHARIGTAISPKSVGSWRTLLTQDDATLIWAVCETRALALGYNQ